MVSIPITDAMNLGPKTSSELTSVGIKTVAQLKKLGWKAAFRKLVATYPERINLNMAMALIGAVLEEDWRRLSPELKAEARTLIKSLKPQGLKRSAAKKPDATFVAFVVNDQLAALAVEARRMFSGYGLYSKGKFFGIIAEGSLYFRTGEASRPKYVAAGSGPFTPSPRQKLKNYYSVPVDVLEDSQELAIWAREALRVATEK